MYIVVVESPSKAKTISAYLGRNYKVIASYGHVRSLPSKTGSVKPENNFEMIYEDLDQAKKLLDSFKNVSKGNATKSKVKIEKLFLATDPDREGEAIAWHVAELLKDHKLINNSVDIKRVVFNSITKNSINDAFKSPREIDINLVEAQKSRQCLDYLVGFSLSPLLWRKLPCMRSAGRVQSVALRLICERDVEIESFISQEYWDITGKFLIGDVKEKNTDNIDIENNTDIDAKIEDINSVNAKLIEYNFEKCEKFSITNSVQANEYTQHLRSLRYFFLELVTKDVLRKPVAPFITSTLQQEAFNKLGFSAKFTMSIAQKLYEGIKIGDETLGLITYMRTDGTYIDDYAISEIRDFIRDKYGNEYLPKDKIEYKNKVKNAQEAHEAIRPTMVSITPEDAKGYLEESYLKLYTLIWRRTVACQMKNAIFKQTTVKIADKTKGYIFKITGSVISFLGFYAAYLYEIDNDNAVLPFKISDIIIGNEVKLYDVLEQQHFTIPPPRFNEAKLIGMMEELGIGRPSTYATIISILQDRKYVFFNQKKFVPDARGRLLIAFLIRFFGEYFAYNFTANLEEELDMVARGEFVREKLLSRFWKNFNEHITSVSQISISDILIDLENKIVTKLFADDKHPTCIKCDSKLKIGISKFGIFLGCTSYPECNYLQNFTNINEDGDLQTEGMSEYPKEFNICVPNSDAKVTLNKGPYGLYLVSGEKKFAIPAVIKSGELSDEIVSKIISLPCIIGKFEEYDIKVALGRFGFYISCNDINYSLRPKLFFDLNFDDSDAVQVLFLDLKKKKELRVNVSSYSSTKSHVKLKKSDTKKKIAKSNNTKSTKENKQIKKKSEDVNKSDENIIKSRKSQSRKIKKTQ